MIVSTDRERFAFFLLIGKTKMGVTHPASHQQHFLTVINLQSLEISSIKLHQTNTNYQSHDIHHIPRFERHSIFNQTRHSRPAPASSYTSFSVRRDLSCCNPVIMGHGRKHPFNCCCPNDLDLTYHDACMCGECRADCAG